MNTTERVLGILWFSFGPVLIVIFWMTGNLDLSFVHFGVPVIVSASSVIFFFLRITKRRRGEREDKIRREEREIATDRVHKEDRERFEALMQEAEERGITHSQAEEELQSELNKLLKLQVEKTSREIKLLDLEIHKKMPRSQKKKRRPKRK